METNSGHKPFLGIRFALVGFNPFDESKLRNKLVNGGGVDVGRYSQNYTHLIIDKLDYEDPICVAARNSGKVVVLGSWVHHSVDLGMPADANSVLYIPPKDLNGIPGAKSLVVCLTGYQRQDRDDIMAMVALMGGQFSKPLVANKVTHLVCYKFEGEKYELAKRIKKMKLVNHRWLEDCLKEWKLLPEANYEISGFELEMMEASGKDSEEEAEDASMKRANKSPLGLRVGVAIDGNKPKSVETSVSAFQTKLAAQGDPSDTNKSKDVWLTPRRINIPHEVMASTDIDAPLQHDCGKTSIFPDAFHDTFANSLEVKPESREVKDGTRSISKSTDRFSPTAPQQRDCVKISTFQDASHDPVLKPFDKAAESTEVKDALTTTYKSTERFPYLAMKSSSSTYSRNTGKSSAGTKSQGNESSIHNGSPGTNAGGLKAIISSDISLTKSNLAADRSSDLENPFKIDKLHGNEIPQMLPQKRSAGRYLSSSKSQKVGSTTETSAALPGLPASFLFPEPEPTLPEQNNVSVSCIGDPTLGGEVAHKLPPSDSTIKSFSSNTKDQEDANLASENMPSECALAATIGKKTPERSLAELAMERSSTVSGLNVLGSNEKPDTEQPKKKTASRKTFGTRPKVKNSGNQKGSICLSKTTLSSDRSNCSSEGKVAAPILESDNQKEMSTPAIYSESSLEVAKKVDSDNKVFDKLKCSDDETNPREEKVSQEYDRGGNQDRVVDIGACKSDEEMEVRSARPEVNDSSNEDAPVDASKSEVDGNTSECGKEASGENICGENAKSLDLHTTGVGKVNNKKTKKSRKGCNMRGNDNEVKNRGNNSVEEKENVLVNKRSRKIGDQSSSKEKPLASKKTAASTKTLTKSDKMSGQISSTVSRKALHDKRKEQAYFIVSGPRFQKNEYRQILKRLKGKVCRDTHQWSYQATHFITPEIRRTEKFFAASASGSWILNGDYLPACGQAGKFLPEEPFEWHDAGLSQDGAINLEASRKWRLVREKTGHGAFYGMRIVIYGDCFVPSLDTLKRAVKAGDGTILATAPPYTRFLNSDTDFAVVSPGMPRADAWIQEFLSHEIPCVLADYLVEYVCKAGYPLDKHVLYNTNAWAERSFDKLQRSAEGVVVEEVASPSDGSEEDDIACEVCGRRDREEVMLICGDEENSRGCGIGTHIDCCDPPLSQVPKHDWFCPKCTEITPKKKRRKGQRY